MMPRPHQKPNETNSSLQMETKHTSTGVYQQGKRLENLNPTFKIQRKTFPKVKIEIVANLLAATLNPKQPDFVTLVISEKWTNWKTKAWTIFWIKDEDLGLFHEVSLINISPTFTNQWGQ